MTCTDIHARKDKTTMTLCIETNHANRLGAIMLALSLLVKSILIILPFLCNKSSDDNGEEFVLDPDELEFLPYEETYSFIPFKDTAKAIAVLVLSSYSIYQLMRMRCEQCKVQILTDQFNVNHNEALQIKTFYSVAEDQLLSIEKQSKELQKRYTKADNLSNQRKELDKLKEDIEFVQSAWIAQYASFGLMEIDPLGTSMISDREVTDQLAKIRKLFDEEVEKLEDYMYEDMMALDEVLGREIRQKSWADIMDM